MDVYSSVEGMLHSGKHGPVPLSQFIFETCILHWVPTFLELRLYNLSEMYINNTLTG